MFGHPMAGSVKIKRKNKAILMTLDEILALPTDALPKILAEAGYTQLNPTLLDYIRALHRSPTLWQPHISWDEAIPLLHALNSQGWLTSISRVSGKLGYIEAIGNCQHHGVYYTNNGPEMLCRLVLIAYYSMMRLQGAADGPA
jgi:hypothetical protein